MNHGFHVCVPRPSIPTHFIENLLNAQHSVGSSEGHGVVPVLEDAYSPHTDTHVGKKDKLKDRTRQQWRSAR